MLLVLTTAVFGHGNIVWPPTWFDANGEMGLTPYMGCARGQCLWFTNWTFVDQVMASDSEMRTYPYSDPDYKLWGTNPWGAPGRAKLHSPCGVYGGNPYGCPAGDENSRGHACPQGGHAFGQDSRAAYGKTLKNIVETEVTAGQELDMHWTPKANHGGGYSYRLCKTPEDGDMTKLTEECFQAGHLDFVGKTSWVQYGDDPGTRIPFEATRSRNETFPVGSQWTMNPIPGCASKDGGVFTEKSDSCANAARLNKDGQRVQYTKTFDKGFPSGIFGFGEHGAGFGEIQGLENFNGAPPESAWWKEETRPVFVYNFNFNIVDKVKIPENLTPGKYVISFRWDCELTFQVWSSCVDLLVKPKA